ncbi:MAG: methyltransferase domain-containing protein, partial [Kiritimatiellia bacterium]
MTNSYETDTLLGQYLDFHYRSTDPDYLPHHPLPEGVTDYPRRCANVLLENSTKFGRALDLGCAVGGSSFALATRFEEVVAIDFSYRFIETARQLAETGHFRHSEIPYTLPSDLRKSSPDFHRGDACNLSEDLGEFDAVLMANLLCRLPDPARCLEGLRRHTHPGSLLFFTTPCSWDEAYTPRDKWLWPTLEALHHHLDPWCENLNVFDMPFVLRDHPRRAQFTVAQA